MNILQLFLFNLCQTTPPATTTSESNNTYNDFLAHGIVFLIIAILVIVIIVLVWGLVASNRELKKTKQLTELSDEQQKLLSEFDNLSDEDKTAALKIIQGLNSKK